MLSSLDSTPAKPSRTTGTKHEKSLHVFVLKSSLWCVTGLNSLHAASGHSFSRVTGERGRQVTPPKKGMFYPAPMQRECSNTWKELKQYIYFKNNTMNWSMGRWSDQVLCINLRFPTDPITGNVGAYTNHLHHVLLQSLSQGSVALY